MPGAGTVRGEEHMTTSPVRRLTAAAFLAGAALALGACNTTQTASGPSGHMVRSSVETAPADLQLLCAAEAATYYGTPSDRILPLSSARSGAASYEVMLDVAGRRARCTIDESGMQILIADA